MKTLLTTRLIKIIGQIILIMSFSLFAQTECSDLIHVSTDRMTGVSKASNYLMITDEIFEEDYLEIRIVKSSDSNTIFCFIFVHQSANTSNCIKSKSRMNVLFRDGTLLELTNFGGTSYIGLFTALLGRKVFREKEIEAMRVSTYHSYVEVDFSNNQSKQFMQTVDCLTNFEF